MREYGAFTVGFVAGAAFMVALWIASSVIREFIDDLRFAVEFDRIARDMEEGRKDK